MKVVFQTTSRVSDRHSLRSARDTRHATIEWINRFDMEEVCS